MSSRSYRDTFYKRTTVVTVFLLLFCIAIVTRLVDVQIIHGQEYHAQAEGQYGSYQKLLPTRGDIKIVDRATGNAEAVATNMKSYLVYAIPPDISNATTTADSLAPILGMTRNDILPKLLDTTKKYVPIKKQLTDQEISAIKNLNLPGLAFDYEDMRVYPEHNLLAHVLGFVGYNQDSDRAGLYGLERYFNDALAGQEGYVSQEKAVGGAWIFGAKRDMQPAINGVNLVLTVDKTIQFQAQQVLADTVTKHGADSGSVIVVNPKTGAILAMASYPDFDPNAYNKVTDPSVFNNEAVMGSYEPGSTFKAITMAAAIDEGKISPDTTYNDTFSVTVDGYTIKNAEGTARGTQTMTQALDFSLNTGAIFAENQLGNGDFYKYLTSFGFGKKTGIELPEVSGNLDNLKGNITVNYDTASFGQGISVTPLQMIEAYTALANNGKMVKPYLVQSKIYPDGHMENTQPTVVGQVVSEKTASTISAMLVDVVENGFGTKAAVKGYYLAGKTGTAQVARKDGKPGYDPEDNIGSFIGYGPVENPQFLMLVRVDHPRDVKFAESTAAPAWGQLAQFILNYLQVPPTRK